MSITEKVYLSVNQELAAFITLDLTYNSEHSVSAAILTYLKRKSINAAKISDYKSVLNKNVDDTFNDVSIHCSNTCWVTAKNLSKVQDLLAKDLMIFCITINN